MEVDYKTILDCTKPGDLFTSDDEKSIKNTYIELCKKYHPDNAVSGRDEDSLSEEDNAKVMSKINELYVLAMLMSKKGIWEKTGYIKIRKSETKAYEIYYSSDYSFELGHVYLTKKKIIYVIAADKKKFADNLVDNLKKIKYKNSKMEENFSSSMPNIYGYFEDVTGRTIVIMDKAEGYYPLREVVQYYGGKLDPRHVAWIISRLSNIVCLLDMNNMTSNGLSVDNLLISPSDHGIAVHGAMFYMTEIGSKMIGTVNDVFEVMPNKVKGNKEAGIDTDLESIKMIGRELCGEKNVVKFRELGDVPDSMKTFLTKGAGRDAYAEFQCWDKSLHESFGARRFVRMEYK